MHAARSSCIATHSFTNHFTIHSIFLPEEYIFESIHSTFYLYFPTAAWTSTASYPCLNSCRMCSIYRDSNDYSSDYGLQGFGEMFSERSEILTCLASSAAAYSSLQIPHRSIIPFLVEVRAIRFSTIYPLIWR